MGGRPGQRQRIRKGSARQEHRIGLRVQRIGGATLLHQGVNAIDLVMPGTAVPVVVARKVQYPRALHVQRHIEVVSQLIEEVRRIGIAAGAIIGAAHVGALAEALVRPAIPHDISVNAHRNHRRLCRASRYAGEDGERASR